MINRKYLSVAALAAATLLFESTLTRLLAVAQFYHFAFLVVSLALLGFGASGTLLSIFPRLRRISLEQLLIWAGIGFSVGVGVAFAGVNLLPFDSYSIAWERRQLLYFLLYYLALTIPFLVSGLGIGGALSLTKGKTHLVYAANLIGSALGALLAPLCLSLTGVPGAVLMSALMGLIPISILLGKGPKKRFSLESIGFDLIDERGSAFFWRVGRSKFGDVFSPGDENLALQRFVLCSPLPWLATNLRTLERHLSR